MSLDYARTAKVFFNFSAAHFISQARYRDEIPVFLIFDMVAFK